MSTASMSNSSPLRVLIGSPATSNQPLVAPVIGTNMPVARSIAKDTSPHPSVAGSTGHEMIVTFFGVVPAPSANEPGASPAKRAAIDAAAPTPTVHEPEASPLALVVTIV